MVKSFFAKNKGPHIERGSVRKLCEFTKKKIFHKMCNLTRNRQCLSIMPNNSFDGRATKDTGHGFGTLLSVIRLRCCDTLLDSSSWHSSRERTLSGERRDAHSIHIQTLRDTKRRGTICVRSVSFVQTLQMYDVTVLVSIDKR